MNGTFADILGLIGGALMVFGYAYSNVARTMNFLVFNALNLVGSALLIVSLCVHFNLASMVLEIVWGAIAAFGLAKVWARRARA